jgi:hypothetical protein
MYFHGKNDDQPLKFWVSLFSDNPIVWLKLPRFFLQFFRGWLQHSTGDQAVFNQRPQLSV